METFRLWLEADEDVPRFKRLGYEKVAVELADVLLKGIHPWQGGSSHLTLPDKFQEILNQEELRLAELAHLGHCAEISVSQPNYYNSLFPSHFEAVLERVRDTVRFVDDLSYLELLKIAKARLREQWSHRVAHRLLSRTRNSFDEMRAFLKKRDPAVKLSGYADLENYDLSSILSLEDFETDDAVLIAEGIPVANFRRDTFLAQVADERGRLRLVGGIRDFQLTVERPSVLGAESLVYNARRDTQTIRLIPEIDAREDKRSFAKAFAERWGKPGERYCFTTDIPGLGEMLKQKTCHIGFPTLTYARSTGGKTSYAKIVPVKTQLYSAESPLKASSPAERIKDVLRNHRRSMTGRKEQLIEKLAQLAADAYTGAQAELDAYFREHRFIRLKSVASTDCQPFPVLNGLDLKGMVLSMYIAKHLRGNAILEAGHENDAFGLKPLALALIRGEIALSGAFMRVQ